MVANTNRRRKMLDSLPKFNDFITADQNTDIGNWVNPINFQLPLKLRLLLQNGYEKKIKNKMNLGGIKISFGKGQSLKHTRSQAK